MPKKRSVTSNLRTYVLGSLLGSGGAGDVFAATSGQEANFAVKILRSMHAKSDKAKRFKNEVNFGSRIHHPNIVPVIDSGSCSWGGDDTLFYVMPLYHKSLAATIRDGVNPEQVIPLFQGLLAGLDAAHRSGVWHRDVKPENVLLDADEHRLLLGDFGIAHFEEENLVEAVETRDTERLANFQFAAPEQRARGREVDHRADLFAAGLLLNFMFTGEIPQGVGYKRVQHVQQRYQYVDDVVERLLQADPSRRPNSAAQVAQELELLIQGPALRKARDLHRHLTYAERKKELFSSPEGVQQARDFVRGFLSRVDELVRTANILYPSLTIEYGCSDDQRYAVLRTPRTSMTLSWYYAFTNSLRDASLTAYAYRGTSLLPSQKNHSQLTEPQELRSTEYVPELDDAGDICFRSANTRYDAEALANRILEDFIALVETQTKHEQYRW